MRLLMTVLLAASLLSPANLQATALTHVASATRPGVSQERPARGARRSYRQRGRGIGAAYRRAGRAGARGGVGFGKNIARARPVRAGKSLGKGAGGFGKHTGVGTARVGKKMGRGVKRIF